MNQSNPKQNHSSHLDKFTRVKSGRKQAKRTIGITLSPRIIEEARKRNLNISRIAEQALLSILEYIQPINESESSKSLNPCSLLRENGWAGRSVWHDRRLRKAEAAGSNPARSTIGLDPVWVWVRSDSHLLAKPKPEEKTRIQSILRSIGLEPFWVWGRERSELVRVQAFKK